MTRARQGEGALSDAIREAPRACADEPPASARRARFVTDDGSTCSTPWSRLCRVEWPLCAWPFPLVPAPRSVRVGVARPFPEPHPACGGVAGDLDAALRDLPDRRSRVRMKA